MIRKFFIAAALMFASVATAYSQDCSRGFIRECIEKYGECKNVAITKSNGDLMLYGKNGYAATDCCPSGLTDALSELNDEDQTIEDVQLTESGRWLVLYGSNGIQWSDIPESLEQILREYNDKREEITSVTFNDNGDWIVITTDHISSSSDEIQDWLSEGFEEYGKLWAACISDDGAMVAVYEKGYKYYGDVPEGLKTALRGSKLDVYRIKIAGTAWFYADKDGTNNYRM